MNSCMVDPSVLTEACKKIGVILNDRQIEQFLIYYEYLIEKNKVMNLTAITEYEEVVQKHFVDSLSIVKVMDMNKKYKLLDLGTGAGFPGIPLKIAFPDLEVTLMDSLNKRIKFLEEVIMKLGLTDITAIHARAEEGARKKEYREQFDICVSRAVANLSSLSEYCLPFVKEKGMFISYKSMKVDDELKNAKKALSLLGGEIKNIKEFVLPDTEIGRSFVVIEKRKSTPGKYPRKAGLPTKEPLGN